MNNSESQCASFPIKQQIAVNLLSFQCINLHECIVKNNRNSMKLFIKQINELNELNEVHKLTKNKISFKTYQVIYQTTRLSL